MQKVPPTSLRVSHGFLMDFSWLSHGKAIACVHLAIHTWGTKPQAPTAHGKPKELKTTEGASKCFACERLMINERKVKTLQRDSANFL